MNISTLFLAIAIIALAITSMIQAKQINDLEKKLHMISICQLAENARRLEKLKNRSVQ